MKCITKKEYVERLSELIPDSQKFNKLVVTNQTVKSACSLIQDISDAVFEVLNDLVEADLVVELKEAMRDQYVLGRFLEISYELIIMDENNAH